MKKLLFLNLVLFGLLSAAIAQDSTSSGEIRLLVRGDDIGFCHAANVGCIESYKFGIMRSVELNLLSLGATIFSLAGSLPSVCSV